MKQVGPVMKNRYSYSEIANNYALWMEYVDPSGLDSEESFNAKSEQEKIEFMARCFGPESKAVDANS